MWFDGTYLTGELSAQSQPTLEDTLLAEIADGLEPDPEEETERKDAVLSGLPLLPWSKRNIYLRDKRTGHIAPFSLRDYLWLVDIYNLIDSELREGHRKRVVLQKGAQLGLTNLALMLTLRTLDGWGSVFYALPPGPTKGNFAHGRVDPIVSTSPRLQQIAGDIDNVGLKTFSGGLNLYIRGTQIPKGDPRRAAQLDEAPADLAVIDEFDRVPPAAVPKIRARLGDSRLAWELAISTPTYPDVGINGEYIDSSQHEPQILCACGEWVWMGWDLVRGPTADDPHARLVCPHCRSPIERGGMWEDGRARWKARRPGSDTLGFWIPKLVSPRIGLDELWEQSESRRETEVQAFWNEGLGLPHEPKGARLTKELIAACANPLYPTFPNRSSWTAMGVDVGLELHYWIKERRPDGRERSVAVGSVLNWEDLDTLMIRYGVMRCVVDDRPELREDKRFQQRHLGRVWLGQEVDSPDAELARWNRKRGVVTIERTKALAEATARIESMVDELPADWEQVPDLLDHMTVNIKAKRVRSDGSTVYHFPQTGKADHLHHAKLFCEVALSILPKVPDEEEDAGDETPTTGKSRYYVPGSMRGRL